MAIRCPPVVAGPAQFLPAVDHDFIQGVLDQPGEVGGGGQARPFRVITAVQVQIAGQGQVQLADAGQPGRFHALPAAFARAPNRSSTAACSWSCESIIP